MRRSFSLLFSLCLIASSGCSNGPDDGLVKFQVQGSVEINGEPQKGVAIVFNHTDPTVTKNAARPVAVTDANGEFTLSTNGPGDGAVEGKYIVTFFWPQGGTSSRDFLKGKYVNKDNSSFEITVTPQDTILPPFELEAPPEDVKEARRILGAARTGPLN